ncbi:ferredoxin family protein [Parabacteroides sp. PF5-9]|uniref:4Fe-4S dicluster domain-containing protein n=1 Tax=Parabacteroides sp. PF5-9 TaxID=1742404 RepID=UPI0024756D95|nr:ferredoxin family protein [Parabacteroides sp. PF5-9]MDH6357982.1 NAD-dependent dihydropyrimidine dehydrogenase PreA subunit [Parabacteroides sp. PF5-9]
MLHKKKEGRTVSLEINKEKCKGCGECVDICRRKVLDMDYGLDRDMAKVAYPNDCIGCGKCLTVCSVEAIELTVDHARISQNQVFAKRKKKVWVIAGIIILLIGMIIACN